MAMSCARCAEDLDHCHGTLITHTDGTAECTTPTCRNVDDSRHLTATPCAALTDCHCTPAAELILLSRAS
jgi:hypothetical protein